MARLSIKLILGIVLSVLLIDADLLIFSVNARAQNLASLQGLEMATYGSVAMFSQEYIESALARYQLNIIGLTLVVAFFVAGGFYFIYYLFVGRYISNICRMNNAANPLMTRGEFNKIPNDEIGLLIRSRISMLDRIEQEMESNRTLLRILSHDLKNLLSVAMGNIGLLRHDLDAENYQQALQTCRSIQCACQQQKELIDAVLKLEKTRRLRGDYVLERHFLPDIVNEAITIFEDKAREKNLTIRIEHDPDDAFQVMTDRALLLNNVIGNLLSNAIKFSFAGSTIDLAIHRTESREIELIVRDHGIGIPEAALKRLQRREGVKSRSGTANEPGTGFGMQILMESADTLGLEVEIASTSVEADSTHQGTEFRLRFQPGYFTNDP